MLAAATALLVRTREFVAVPDPAQFFRPRWYVISIWLWQSPPLRNRPAVRFGAADLSLTAALCIGFALLPLLWALAGIAQHAIERVRRSSRIKRGECAVCGYDLQAAPAGRCPECGTPVPAPVRCGRDDTPSR